jgi:xanthine dehydrogenase YagR molybdenum-binding subunit
MSILQKIMETVVQFVPDKEPDPLIGHKHGYVGKPFSRVDGQLKVKGEATFAAEFKLENVVYAAIVYSNITKGKITNIDSTEAEKANGFVAIITHENAPKMNKVPTFGGGGNKGGSGASTVPPMQDAKILYNGQPVAVVVAETQDQAEYITSLVRVEYEIETAEVSFEAALPKAKSPGNIMGEPAEVKIGDAENSLEKAK